MSNFGAKLEELLEKRKMSAAELSRATGISDALLSKWINGQQRFVSPEHMELLTAAISSQASEQAELIRAHLLDENVGQGSQLIDIHILGSGQVLHDSGPAYKVVPPLKIQRALEVLGREAITDADIRGILISLASLCDKE